MSSRFSSRSWAFVDSFALAWRLVLRTRLRLALGALRSEPEALVPFRAHAASIGAVEDGALCFAVRTGLGNSAPDHAERRPLPLICGLGRKPCPSKALRLCIRSCRGLLMDPEAIEMARWEGFRQCPGCGFDFASGEGERSCSWGDCPYLPEELNVFCDQCRFNFFTMEGNSPCEDPLTCVHATEPRSHVENLRKWERSRRLTGS